LAPERQRAIEQMLEPHAGRVACVTVSLWRIAADTPLWMAEDTAGKGAAHNGARRNHAGEHITYAATSISLEAWETRAHFGEAAVCPGTAIPFDRRARRLVGSAPGCEARPPRSAGTGPEGLV